MIRTQLAAGLVALSALVAPTALRADDTIRLNLYGTGNATIRPLVADAADLDAETIDARWGGYRGFRGGVGWGGGWRGGWGGGWRGGWGGGWRGGYRGIGVGWGGGWRGGWGGGWRGGWGGGWGGYRGIGWGYRGIGWGYRGFGWGGYPAIGWGGYSYPVYSYPVYTYPSYYPCTIVTTTPTVAPVTTLEYRLSPTTPTPYTVPTPPRPGLLPPPTMPRADGTYSYDGGPMVPVPMPRAEDETMLPRVPTPVIDRVVSLPIEPTTGKWQYPAYGEEPRRTGR